jgi:hypothetical protein
VRTATRTAGASFPIALTGALVDGRKKGAAGGSFGGSFGLFRARISSSRNRVIHCARGSPDSVTAPSADAAPAPAAASGWAPSASPPSTPPPAAAALSAASSALSAAPSSPASPSSPPTISNGSGSSMRTGSSGARSRKTSLKYDRLAHWNSATLPACVVVRNSPDGEKQRDVTGDWNFSQSTHLAVGTSNTRTVPSMEQEANQRTSGLNARSLMRCRWPPKRRTSRRLARSYTRITTSSLATATSPASRFSSSLHAGLPRFSVCRQSCECMSQNFSVPSSDAETTVRLSASTPTPVTPAVWRVAQVWFSSSCALASFTTASRRCSGKVRDRFCFTRRVPACTKHATGSHTKQFDAEISISESSMRTYKTTTDTQQPTKRSD